MTQRNAETNDMTNFKPFNGKQFEAKRMVSCIVGESGYELYMLMTK